ncbi:MAG: lytic transglycosylase domain-containing protein [Rhodanobacter sp.]|nr:MAG: lytic transglycosylase domain-containing protein [Rhodanobacter sp.]TAL94999.1 MAG: lytic transglycosylase domain-containing protein [Rhodanobacter sp.]TAM43142.1 MAG: lytic transglycosylase domain-containing protein [Rhodanobacter sp.]TAN26352.1 MAG: lytic transglycosylase domain-containing protein [Rhodanobacter sp.]
MSAATSYGGNVDRPARCFPLRPILAGVALLAACLFGDGARAATLYQCTGSRGETAYSSSRAGYRGCHAISSYTAPRPRRREPRRERSSLSAVTGTVTTTARSRFADRSRPVSLEGVRGSVATTARPMVDAMQASQMSLTHVHGSVETSARLPLAVAAAGTPGAWRYRESHGDAVLAAPVVADASANRVLRGAVYRLVHADGSVEYTNMQPAGGKGRAVTMLFSYISTCVACNLHSTIHWNSVALNLDAYADTIRAASMEYGVDEAFLRAIIHAESAFNPRALSIKGAQGLMQLMPTTASDMGVLDAFNSDQNIRGGARYLSLLLHDFNGNERLAAAAYNAGPGAVQRYRGVPPYAETEVYVERVETLRKRYGEAIHPPLASRGPG